MSTPSNIYEFMDYRDFLKDRYRQLKAADPVFSFRFFSKQAGFGSPNYLKLVMDGKRNISFEAIAKFAKGLRLDGYESEYFRYMVEFNQCDHPTKKKVFEAKLLYLRELFKVKAVIPELYDYYHQWYHAAIREMVRKGSLKNDPAQIGRALVPAISEEQARESVALLTQLGFIHKTNENVLVASDKQPQVDVENAEVVNKIYHEQMAELATQSLYTQTADTLKFESVTLSLPKDRIGELQTKIQALVDELSSQTSVAGAEQSVFQLNIQLFALTRPQEPSAKERDVDATLSRTA